MGPIPAIDDKLIGDQGDEEAEHWYDNCDPGRYCVAWGNVADRGIVQEEYPLGGIQSPVHNYQGYQYGKCSHCSPIVLS